jgi:hypothetical protein
MLHRRAEIRDAIAATLIATNAFRAVDTSRVRRTQDHELPVALVYALSEKSGEVTLARMIVVEICVATTATLDDQIDALCLSVEAAMGADPTFGRQALDSVLDSTQIGLNGEGDLRHGVALLTYGVTYRTTAGNPAA